MNNDIRKQPACVIADPGARITPILKTSRLSGPSVTAAVRRRQCEVIAEALRGRSGTSLIVLGGDYNN